MDYFNNYLSQISTKIRQVDVSFLEEATKIVLEAHAAGNKVILAGNGGSAAIASHVAVDLTKNAGVRSINFNETNLITCLANDYGYANWVEKAIAFYADKGDIVILISSSGRSQNIINGGRKSRELGLKLITLSGFSENNPLRKMGEVNMWVDSEVYNAVEVTHQAWLAAIVDRLTDINSANG